MYNNWLFAAFMVSAENGILSRQNGIFIPFCHSPDNRVNK